MKEKQISKTEALREEIAVCSRNDAYEGLGLGKYNKGWRKDTKC